MTSLSRRDLLAGGLGLSISAGLAACSSPSSSSGAPSALLGPPTGAAPSPGPPLGVAAPTQPCQTSRPQKGGCMHIVPTGMHYALVCRLISKVGFFLYWQGINIGA